ncbi:hypothetical protein KXX11_002199, partial [Aspergillus fumigatus]
MIQHSILGALALLSCALPSNATQIFRNTGTLAGWDSFNHEHSGTVQQVSNVV